MVVEIEATDGNASHIVVREGSEKTLERLAVWVRKQEGHRLRDLQEVLEGCDDVRREDAHGHLFRPLAGVTGLRR